MAPSVGGSIISLYGLLKGLDRTRYEPSLVLRRGHPAIARFEDLGVEVHPINAGYTGAMAGASPRLGRVRRSKLVHLLKRSATGERLVHEAGFWLRTWPELRREAAELQQVIARVEPDLLHLNDIVSVCRPGIMAARATRVPAICHLRAMAKRSPYDRWLSRSLRGYICISQAVAAYHRQQGGKLDPYWVVYNGLDLDEYAATPAESERIRQRVRATLGYAPDDFVVGCIGRLRPWKGQHVLLRAAALLAPRWSQLRVLIVGSPERHESDYDAKLRALATELGVRDMVTFAGFREDIPDLLRGMDLMVHASVSPEPFGRVIIESMAAGTAVLATDGGAVPEIIQDGVSGKLVPSNDARAMAAGIAYAIEHPEARAAWARVAREQVEARFALAHHVHGVQEVYEAILK